MDIYERASTRVRSLCGETEDFTVRVGVYLGLVLSSYLCFLVMYEVKKIYRVYHGTCYLQMIKLFGERLEVNGRLLQWREAPNRQQLI